MEKRTIYHYYAFGYNYHIIKNSGYEGWAKEDALESVRRFISSLTELDLQVTRKIAEDIQPIIRQFETIEGKIITDDLAKKLTEKVEKLDSALDAELQLKAAYILSKKRYPLDSLINAPQDLLAKGVFATLTEISKRDYQLACTQIALSQPTAAAFHLMRMLEEQVRVLYFAFKKTNRMENPMWGPILKQLREKRAPKPSEKLINHLNGMRVHFRNPTQHPDTFYTLDEAQDLLNQTITAVNMIAAELPK